MSRKTIKPSKINRKSGSSIGLKDFIKTWSMKRRYVVLSVLIFILIIPVYHAINAIMSKSGGELPVAAVNGANLTFDEYKYFLNKARIDRALPEDVLKKIPVWDASKVWSMVFDGKKLLTC